MVTSQHLMLFAFLILILLFAFCFLHLYCIRMAFQFTDSNFKTETAKGFAVVDFYADWCGPCRMMEPVFEELAKQYEGKVKMGKMNVDDSPQTPGSFGVTGIPTVVFLKDGAEVGRLVGFQPSDALAAKLTEMGVK